VVPPLAIVLNVAAFVVVKRAVDDVFGTTGGDAQASMVELRDKVNGPLLGLFIFFTVRDLLLSGLWILLGLKMRTGRHYARSALDLLAMAAFIPLVFLRRSNRYFTARRPPA
jgi:hypothetical protein